VNADPAPFKRILVPVDFSPRSAGALRFAVALGSRDRAEIEVLHVWHSDLATKVTVARDHAKNELRAFVAGLNLRGDVDLKRRTDHGDPYLTIQRTLQLAGHDLLVVAGPEATRSEAETVSRRLLVTAPCPVLVVPAHCRARARSETDHALRLERILLPLALTDRGFSGLACAESLARADRASIELLSTPDTAPEQLLAFRARAAVERCEELAAPERIPAAIFTRLRDAAYDLLIFSDKRAQLGERRSPTASRLEQLALTLPCPSLSLPARDF